MQELTGNNLRPVRACSCIKTGVLYSFVLVCVLVFSGVIASAAATTKPANIKTKNVTGNKNVQTKVPLPKIVIVPTAHTTSDGSGYGKDILSLDELFKDTTAILPRQKGIRVKKLSLQQCISKAMRYNLDIQVNAQNPAISVNDIVKAQAAFDAVLFGSVQFDTTDRSRIDSTYYTRTIQTNSGTKKVRVPYLPFDQNHDYNYSIGLKKMLPTGATIQLSQNLRRYNVLSSDGDSYYRNPFFEYGLQLQLRQPLLRDFGIDVNRAEILSAQNNYRISKEQFELQVIKTAGQVEANYWRLFLARQQVKIFANLLNRAQNTLTRVLERGKYDGSSLAEARAAAVVKKARANLLSARNTVLQQQDQLLNIMNDPSLPLDKNWEIITTDTPLSQRYQTQQKQALQTAIYMRPEIPIQKLRIDNARLQKDVAKNQKLPRLDLVAQQEITGAGDNYHNAWDQQWKYNTVNYTFGISAELPLGNRAARAMYGKSRLVLEQEELQLKNIRQQILADVNMSLHNLDIVYKEIGAWKKAVEADKNEVLNYLAIMDTQRQDSVTPEFLNLKLNADERLANSQISALRAIVQYNLAIMDVNRAQGTLLQYDNIKLEPTKYRKERSFK